MWFAMTSRNHLKLGRLHWLSRTLDGRQQRHPTQTRKLANHFSAYLCGKCTVVFI